MTSTAKRRWFAFSLRTFFVALTIVGSLLGWLAVNVHQVRSRADILMTVSSLPPVPSRTRDFRTGQPIADLSENRGHVYLGGEEQRRKLPFMWRLLGTQPVSRLVVTDAYPASADLEQMRRLFPEAWFSLRTVTDPLAQTQKSWPPLCDPDAKFIWQ